MKNTKLFMFAACTLFLAACGKQTVKIMTPPDASNRVLFSAEQLQTTLKKEFDMAEKMFTEAAHRGLADAEEMLKQIEEIKH